MDHLLKYYIMEIYSSRKSALHVFTYLSVQFVKELPIFQ